MKVLVAAQTSVVGGGRTYLIRLIEAIGELATGWHWVFWVPSTLRGVLPDCPGVDVVYRERREDTDFFSILSNLRRRRRDCLDFREMVDLHQPDVIFGATEFSLPAKHVPQVLLVRNRIYYDGDWYDGIESGRDRLNIRLRRLVARRSMLQATRLVFPSRSMQGAVFAFLGRELPSDVLHYGAPRVVARVPKKRSLPRQLRLLNVSSYYPQKNLSVLLRAAALLMERGQLASLTLTGDPRGVHGSRARTDAELVGKLEGYIDIHDDISYHGALSLYAHADAFIFPSLCESFGHPLVEAMSCGVPVFAADTEVNREICGSSAFYFDGASAQDLVRAINRAKSGGCPAASLSAIDGRFSWVEHVRGLQAALERAVAEYSS